MDHLDIRQQHLMKAASAPSGNPDPVGRLIASDTQVTQVTEEHRLARAVPEPLHKQISAQMRANIAVGVWPPHYKLRAEPELATELGVSRGTLRRALRTLIAEGLLVQVQGKGTFVKPKTIEPPIAQELLSLAEGLRRLGIAFETTVRSSRMVLPPVPVQALLDLPSGTQVFRLERVRSIEGDPVALSTNFVRTDLSPGIEGIEGIETFDYTRKTLFGVMEQECGLRLASGRRTFEAQAASREVSEALRIAEGSPVLYLEQVTYLADGRPVEYSDVWIRGDRLKLSSVLTRGDLAARNDLAADGYSDAASE